MLDVLSGGRIECAFPLGTGMEYWVNPVNPSIARERFREAMEVLMQAWTKPGPTRFDGEFFQYKYLNPFPLPYQKPHPKIYIVGSGSEETVQYAAEKGFGYSQVFIPLAAQLKSFDFYRARRKPRPHAGLGVNHHLGDGLCRRNGGQGDRRGARPHSFYLNLLLRRDLDEHATGLHAGRAASQAA